MKNILKIHIDYSLYFAAMLAIMFNGVGYGNPECTSVILEQSSEADHLDNNAIPGNSNTTDFRYDLLEKFQMTRQVLLQHTKELYEKVKKDVPDILPEEVAAIHLYSMNTFRPINMGLRNNDPSMLVNYEDVIYFSKTGSKKLPAYQGTVYRSTELNGELFKKLFDQYNESLATGNAIVEPAFLSTSKSEDSIQVFQGNLYYEIESITGVDISNITKTTEELEVLFAPDSQFKVTEIINEGGGIWTIVMEEVVNDP